jgi:hypothetical protein
VSYEDTSEREMSSDHLVVEDTKGPHIGGSTKVILLENDFRGHVVRSTTEEIEFLVIFGLAGETKVNDLNILAIIKKNILKLNVSMVDALTMTVGDCIQNLLHDE